MHDDRYYQQIEHHLLSLKESDRIPFLIRLLKDTDTQLEHAYLHIGDLLTKVPDDVAFHRDITTTIKPSIPILSKLATFVLSTLKTAAPYGFSNILNVILETLKKRS